ncbi:MAG TPA: R3H domain-containing nucleic acid-binding protein [Dehalococcoidia bacterium]|jgi:stage III sporulation protein SpoIIIAA|nr:R3H domain-containing nucleic acid-binding protein [Dehalococcoidia bacterium]
MLNITDDLDTLLDVLPSRIGEAIRARPNNYALLEIVLDLGRLPEARYPHEEAILSENEVSDEDIDYVVQRIGEFTSDNRAGIERTLHRISCIRNRKRRIVGLTCRVGRAVFGTIRIIEDLVRNEQSVLLLGRPGVGKTTMLREVARFMADELNKRVIVVDTSNEIAGDGDIPHPGIGSARRMQVPSPELQHAVMIEAVENHMPEVIIIDEIGTDLEASAARTIAERGVQLIATAHGNELENLIMNPTLSDLVGGIQSVTLSDEEARRRGTQKAILERRAPPTFDVLIEIQTYSQVAIHQNVAETVDAILRGYEVPPEMRELTAEGEVKVLRGGEVQRPVRRGETRQDLAYVAGGPAPERGAAPRERRIYPFGVSRQRLEQALRETRFPGVIVDHLDDADVVITLRPYYRRKPQTLHDAESRGVPIYVVKSNTILQLEQVLLTMRSERAGDPVVAALKEAEDGIGQVLNAFDAVDLSPQNAYIRRLQHMLAQRYNLSSRSLGSEPNRYVRILPGEAG